MAKGDLGGTAQAGQAQPKIDQYSVMHKLMDAFGGNQPAQNMGPSPNMQMPNPSVNQSPSIMDLTGGRNSGVMGPQMGGRFGGGGMMAGQMGQPIMGGTGSLAPSNPQDMLRRSMTGSRTFGQ